MSSNDRNMWPIGPAGPIPGTAEYLNCLVDGTGKCKCLSSRPKAGDDPKLPRFLSFFTEMAVQEAREYSLVPEHPMFEREINASETGPFRPPMSRLDTRNICMDCYKKAAPEGFTTWSLSYEKRTFQYGTFPPQITAGSPIDADSYLGERSINFPSFDARVIFRKMAHDGRPIYIDRLHGETKWIPNLTDKVERERQNAAINRENGAAYMSATRIYRADGDFGAGQNTTAEHRVGYGRLAVVRPDWRLAMPREDSPQKTPSIPATEMGEPSEDEEEASQQITASRPIRRDIPREWLPPGPYAVYTYYMENAHGQWPEKPPVRRLSISRVDKIETDMTGLINPTAPSQEELARFAREKESRKRWDEREKYLSRHDRIRIGDALLIAHGYPKDKIPNIPTEAYEDIVRISDDDDRGPGVWELRDSFTGTGTPGGFFYENISRQDLVKHYYPSRSPGLGLSSPPTRTFQVSDAEVYLQYGDWSEDARFKVNVYSIEITRPQKDETDESGI
ncbi:hypothetical protein CTAM01_10888 [Colletotrichum tamarilloi]|uniref:Uncharacterized protein n=1 Tax=Colletotrichum tamarilloi TaxID=1209934 RepID=A0ABQ9QYZ0_9PEZI|nr:uncharacterized protein CTAM01_10888 [Colletotrichum tamarilloi]KAK1490038.1 hypothetical protein CTAM01_10888 [Colletotrichum tamarilloi]